MRQLMVLASLTSLVALAEVRQGDSLVVSKTETIAEDLYVTGGTVEVNGVVEGDVVVAAGEVRINGVVKGDVLLWSGRAVVAGVVDGSVRGLMGQLELSGQVGGDVVVGSGQLSLSPSASVGRDVMVGAGTVTVKGPVARNLRVAGGQVTLDAPVGGFVEITAQQADFGPGALVTGDVKVTSPSEVVRAAGSIVNGRFEHVAPVTKATGFASALFGFWRRLFALLMTALLWRLLFPGFARRAATFLVEQPVRALGFGALAAIVVPAALGLALVLGIVLGGWWLAALGGVVAVFASANGVGLVGQVTTEWLARKFKLELGMVVTQVLGVLALCVLFALPFLGPLIGLMVTLFGLGAQLLALPGRIRLTSEDRLDGPPFEPPFEVPLSPGLPSPS